MNAVSLALILGGVLLNAGAQLLLKAAALRAGPIPLAVQSVPAVAQALASGWFVAGIACYAVSVLVWLVALTRVDVSVAYPMLSIGYVVNALGAWLLLGETLSPLRLAGMAVIVFGVCLLAASGRAA